MSTKPEDHKAQLCDDAAMLKVRELLANFRSAMLVTRGPSGDLHARPLALQGDPSRFGGVLWFFVDDRSRKVQECAGGVLVSVVCQSDQHSAYLQLNGTASIVRDTVRMKELYTPVIKAWFPQGLEDPHLTLLRFEALNGAYWESLGVIEVLLALGKSMLTGRPGAGGRAGDLSL